MGGEEIARVDERPEAARRAHDDLAGALPEPLSILQKWEATDKGGAVESLQREGGAIWRRSERQRLLCAPSFRRLTDQHI